MKSDVVGIVRFSMVSETPRGFPALLGKSLIEREREIFDPARMEQRLAFLESLLVPTLTRQTDQDFRVAVVTTKNLPLRYRDRLSEILSILPQAAILNMPVSAPLRLACRQSLRQYCRTDRDRWCTFRVDDDDGLACDFIAQIRGAMVSAKRPIAVTCIPGIDVIVGRAFRYRLAKKKCGSVGLCLVAFNGRQADTPFDTVYQLGAHRRVGDHVPVLTVEGPPRFIRLIHPTNISEAGAAAGGYLTDEEAERTLTERFGFDSQDAFEAAIKL